MCFLCVDINNVRLHLNVIIIITIYSNSPDTAHIKMGTDKREKAKLGDGIISLTSALFFH